jgi:hypothetical protein
LLVTKNPRKTLAIKNHHYEKRKNSFTITLCIFFATTAFAQITSQKIDSLMEDALAKFKVAEQQ